MAHEREVLLARERAARIQAETSARARDEFLAIVSHELRAPLNGIQSWAHVLENYMRDSAAPALAQRAVTGIKAGIAQQVRLIEDLLDVTRMVSGKLRLVKQPLAFLPVVQAALESVKPLAASRRIELTCNYKITAEQIKGDADRVQQIIWNLLSNAIKFTPEHGKVWITAEAAGGAICVTVQDSGIGISAEFLPHIFDRFSQQDTSSTRGHSGLGLGLFLVRHLVELLAQHFLDELNTAHGSSKMLSADALSSLIAYHWPGNVRELRNYIHRAYILADQTIDATMLAPVTPSHSPAGLSLAIPVGTSLAEVDRKFIFATLELCGGVKKRAADLLGISLKTLYNRLEEYGHQCTPLELSAAEDAGSGSREPSSYAA